MFSLVVSHRSSIFQAYVGVGSGGSNGQSSTSNDGVIVRVDECADVSVYNIPGVSVRFELEYIYVKDNIPVSSFI